MKLGVVLFIAIFLRFFQLGVVPPSLTWDEAAWGYNAYTFGIDARDEFGKFLPLNYIESFGDFKPPLYAYLAILPVKFFGLTEFATRFPSALFGVLTVLITYFLTKRLLRSHDKRFTNNVALLSAFLIAISPWHINLSRAAFEANVSTFFIACGVWLFVGGLQEKKWYLLFSAASFALSFYVFNTARVFIPLFLFVLAVFTWKKLKDNWRTSFIACVIFFVIILPVVPFLFSPQASLRFKEVNIFSNIDIIKTLNQEVENDNNAFWSKIIHNRRFAYTLLFLKHYFDNLNPNFLFIKGDGNPKFSTQEVGQLYLWEAPFLTAGAFLLFRKRPEYFWIIPLWLFLGIIPAGTARETPHALRIETILPTLQILVAFGLASFLLYVNQHIKRRLIRGSIFFLLGALIVGNFIYYFHGYYTHYPREYSHEWQYGYKEAIEYVKTVENKYDAVYITLALGRPYIYVLFYTKFDPDTFRKTLQVRREAFGFVHVDGFEKYIFYDKEIQQKKLKKTLFIAVKNEVPSNARILQTFKNLYGDTAFIAYTL